ncbi:MAG TPA: hypothetical protein VGW38_11805 [Chloroflexota bacterium]|nr:hypothetical protein [Chloroflexota bacterium]
MADSWGTDGDVAGVEERVRTIITGLVRLASDDEACRILGVDGTLEDEVDLGFLLDPAMWIAGEIAGALESGGLQLEGDEDEEELAPGQASLSTIVALVRLYRVLRGGSLDEVELRDAVMQYALGDDEDEE